jgi:hypothetical protein
VNALSAFFLFAAACGGQAFEAAFVENEQPEFSRVMQALAEAPPREERAVIAYIAGTPKRLVVFDVATARRLWATEVEPTSAPVVTGDLVLVQESRGVVARALEDGAERFVIDAEDARFVGADSDGTFTVVALSEGPEASPRGLVVGARGNSVLWDHELQLPVGVPAISGGIVIVPWATQRVSFLDALDGHERTRVRVRDAVVGQAFVSDGATYVGQHGIFQITEALESGSRRSAPYYEPQARPLPAQPSMMRDGYAPVPPPDHAHHRVRLVWQVEGTGEDMGPRDGRVYFVFYRFLFAFDANSEELAWAASFDTDIAGATSIPGGILFVSQDGTVSARAAEDGRSLFAANLEERVEVAVLRSGAMAAAEGEAPEVAPESAPSLAAQLYAIARTEDARLPAGRALGARYLGRIGGEDVTGQLVTLCADRDEPEPLRREACSALEARTEGSQHVRVALRKRASFLEHEGAPPVGALSRAAAAMSLRNVVPDLLSHLGDPATPSAELPGLFDGLGALGVRTAARPIEEFLRLYHATGDDPELVSGLGRAAHALIALRGRDAVETLQAMIADPFTPASAREEARAAIASLDRPAEAAPEVEEPAEEVVEAPPDTRPTHITAAITTRVFARVDDQLRACLVGDTRSARVTMLVAPDGTIGRVVVSPASMQACVAPIITGHQFPETRRTRPESIVHTIRKSE